ncbi:MAG: helix-turn-helix transcriptional regulator [Halieaceae bacterium]|jgi:AraC-like DNA-binding protein|nr:helix-turn-helix transcriptional regulator [Halieaceae bacterium]
MVEWFFFLRGIALGLLVALALGLGLRFRKHYAVRVLMLLTFSLMGYVLAPVLYDRSPWFYPAGLASDTIPMVFLLFVQALFDDQRRPSPGTLGLGATYIALGYLASGWPGVLVLDELGMSLPRLLSRVIMVLMMAYAMLLTLRQWRQDLVEPRRRLRLTVTVIIGAYILGVLVVESLYGTEQIPDGMELVHSAGIGGSTLLFMAVLMSLGPDGLLAASVPSAQTAPQRAAAETPELATVIAAMEEELLYRDTELTIRGLGDRVGIPEHRLRKLINSELGYRNFNDFLNHYRLREVSDRLVAPDSRHLPILTIAMDSGYRSLTTFNRAFKASFGLTPREYREKH